MLNLVVCKVTAMLLKVKAGICKELPEVLFSLKTWTAILWNKAALRSNTFRVRILQQLSFDFRV
jgi:hypothetical protein